MTSQGSKRPRPRSQAAGGQRSVPLEPNLRKALATELFGIIGGALHRFGLTPEEQAEAFRCARELTEPVKVSGPILRDTWALSHLLTEWSRAPEYLDEDGQPRALKILGSGRTFESLAKRFLPSKSVTEVIALAQTTAEVSLLPDDKIALLGSILVKRTHSRQTLLAHTIRHIDQLLQTVLHNADTRTSPRSSANSRMERMVLGVIRKDRFQDMMAELQSQIYDLLVRVDSAVQKRLPLTAAEVQESTTVSVGVYISDEPDWERAGIDPETLVPPSQD